MVQITSVGMIISIHAPVKGATNDFAVFIADCTDFNPRSREGSDFANPPVTVVSDISIHAPVKGATSFLLRLLLQILIFQSTLP